MDFLVRYVDSDTVMAVDFKNKAQIQKRDIEKFRCDHTKLCDKISGCVMISMRSQIPGIGSMRVEFGDGLYRMCLGITHQGI